MDLLTLPGLTCGLLLCFFQEFAFISIGAARFSFSIDTLASFPIVKMYNKQEPDLYLQLFQRGAGYLCLRIRISSNSFMISQE